MIELSQVERDLIIFLKKINLKIDLISAQYPFLSAHQIIPILRKIDSEIKLKIQMLQALNENDDKRKYHQIVRKLEDSREELRNLQKRSLSKRGVMAE